MKFTFWILFILLAIFILLFQNFITLNIPWWDDFQGILSPVDILRSNVSFTEKYKILFSQNNEHRVVLDRVVLLLITILNGGVANMKLLAMSGTGLLIALAYILVRIGRKLAIPFFFLLPIPLLLFSAHNYEILQSLMVPYQIFAVLLISFSAFYLACKRSRLHWLIILSTLAIFSHGNGLLTIPIIGLILLLTNRSKALIMWTVYAVGIISFYFFNYKSPTWNKNISPLEDPFASFLYFFEFLGSFSIAFVNLSDTLSHSAALKLVPTGVGLILFSIFAVAFFKEYLSNFSFKNLPKKLTENSSKTFLLACLLFLFATGFMMALKRTGFPMSSRYVINSQLVLILIFLFSYETIKIALIKKVLIFFTFTYFIIAAFNYLSVGLNFKNSLEVDAENWKNNNIWLTGYTNPSQTFNLNILLHDPIRNQLYGFPSTWLSENIQHVIRKDTLKVNFSYNQSILEIQSEDPKMGIFSQNYPNIVWLKSDKGKFLVNFYYKRNPLAKWINSLDYFNDKVEARVYTELIPKGPYTISILKMENNQLCEYPTSIVITNKNDLIKFEY